jgi:hypothetical protein
VKQHEPAKKWTVQVKSSTDKSSADVWTQNLKTKGYDAFMVKRLSKNEPGTRFVWAISIPEAAEVLRQALASQEGFNDAFSRNNHLWKILTSLL